MGVLTARPAAAATSAPGAAYQVAKRVLDVGVAGATLVVAAPALLVVAGAIAATMGRPVLFSQRRLGRLGRPFTLYKFRTMRADDGRAWDPSRDADRLTRLGRFLRRWSLDELPQLWNVLRGDMSLVGPRPLPVEYGPRYSPTQFRRHEAPPGLTGWAQVNGRNATTWEQRFAHDVWYVDHRSLALDLRILALTARRVVSGSGVSGASEATMSEFRG